MGSTNYPLLTSFPFDTKLSLKKNTSEFNSVVELSIKGVHANFLQFYEITLSTISSVIKFPFEKFEYFSNFEKMKLK